MDRPTARENGVSFNADKPLTVREWRLLREVRRNAGIGCTATWLRRRLETGPHSEVIFVHIYSINKKLVTHKLVTEGGRWRYVSLEDAERITVEQAYYLDEEAA